MSFTLGPWEAKPYGVRPDDGPTCYRITSKNGEVIAYTPEYSRLDWDNACLLKAAPDLLEALEAMVEATERWNEAMESIIGRQPHTSIDLEAAKAALAKARGEA